MAAPHPGPAQPPPGPPPGPPSGPASGPPSGPPSGQFDWPSLPPPLSGQRYAQVGAAGPQVVWIDGTGAPLLLVHSINAAASAAEMAPLHQRLRRQRTVFTPDLPGYGHAPRLDRPYSPRLYTDAIHDALALVQQRCGDVPVDAVALSLGCEFLARAALEAPARFGRLALISPTGLSGQRSLRGQSGSTRQIPGMLPLLRGPGWGGALFRGLTRPGVIRYFLERTWGSKQIDEDLWRFDVLATRVPGAQHAPLHFLSGALFSADIHAVYEALAQPVWASHGVRGDFTDYRGKTLLQGRPHWQFSVLPTGAMPHFEQADAFAQALLRFLAGQPPDAG